MPSIHAVYGRITLFVSGLETWRYHFPFVMLLLSINFWMRLSIGRAASFRVRRYAILKAPLFWDMQTCHCVFFAEFSAVSLGHLDRSMHDIISQRYGILICTAVQDSRLYHVTFSKLSAGKCCQKCCFSTSSILPLLLLSLLVSSTLGTKFFALN